MNPRLTILTTHEHARTDEEFQTWIGELFTAAVREFRKDSGTQQTPEIQYSEARRRVRAYTDTHDFTYSVMQLTGDPTPMPLFHTPTD